MMMYYVVLMLIFMFIIYVETRSWGENSNKFGLTEHWRENEISMQI